MREEEKKFSICLGLCEEIVRMLGYERKLEKHCRKVFSGMKKWMIGKVCVPGEDLPKYGVIIEGMGWLVRGQGLGPCAYFPLRGERVSAIVLLQLFEEFGVDGTIEFLIEIKNTLKELIQ
jgi:hypothetical protein